MVRCWQYVSTRALYTSTAPAHIAGAPRRVNPRQLVFVAREGLLGGTMRTWLTVAEGAEYAGVSRDTIYTACERRSASSKRCLVRLRLPTGFFDDRNG